MLSETELEFYRYNHRDNILTKLNCLGTVWCQIFHSFIVTAFDEYLIFDVSSASSQLVVAASYVAGKADQVKQFILIRNSKWCCFIVSIVIVKNFLEIIIGSQ